MDVCCECCVLSGRGLCDELITRPGESYRLWCVVGCDLENLKNEEAMTRVGSQRHSKKKKKTSTYISQPYLFIQCTLLHVSTAECHSQGVLHLCLARLHKLLKLKSLKLQFLTNIRLK